MSSGNNMSRELVKFGVAAIVGTLTLLALADNPWDGDELFKGPLTGLLAYSGGDLKNIYERIRNM